ncbi:MAG: DUF6763 family protein [Gammaproteobacteria bacterium]|jgi:hypothetical protein
MILFQEVAFNTDDGLVEVQHFDGDLEEIPFEDWYELDLDTAEAPVIIIDYDYVQDELVFEADNDCFDQARTCLPRRE